MDGISCGGVGGIGIEKVQESSPHQGGIGQGPCGGQILAKNMTATPTKRIPTIARMMTQQDNKPFFIK
jgi:hypothetical protein